jgi:hypothetical protein
MLSGDTILVIYFGVSEEKEVLDAARAFRVVRLLRR